MNPQTTITARKNGTYCVHFYYNDEESNVICNNLQDAMKLVSEFLTRVSNK
jgi:hypothetical protein